MNRRAILAMAVSAVVCALVRELTGSGDAALAAGAASLVFADWLITERG